MGFLFVESSLLLFGVIMISHCNQIHDVCAGAEARLVETDKAGQGLLRGEEEASQERGGAARAGARSHHASGGGQGAAAVQSGPTQL